MFPMNAWYVARTPNALDEKLLGRTICDQKMVLYQGPQVWPGEAGLADPGKIPHLHWADDPEWAYGGGLYHVRCDYRLMIDNLMERARAQPAEFAS